MSGLLGTSSLFKLFCLAYALASPPILPTSLALVAIPVAWRYFARNASWAHAPAVKRAHGRRPKGVSRFGIRGIHGIRGQGKRGQGEEGRGKRAMLCFVVLCCTGYSRLFALSVRGCFAVKWLGRRVVEKLASKRMGAKKGRHGHFWRVVGGERRYAVAITCVWLAVASCANALEVCFGDHQQWGCETLKIGRSIDVEKRFSEYARQYSADPPDGYVVIYQTKSPAHAKEVQEELLWQFSNHPKCLNDTIHSAGGESTLYVQYVYVLIWIKEGR